MLKIVKWFAINSLCPYQTHIYNWNSNLKFFSLQMAFSKIFLVCFLQAACSAHIIGRAVKVLSPELIYEPGPRVWIHNYSFIILCISIKRTLSFLNNFMHFIKKKLNLNFRNPSKSLHFNVTIRSWWKGSRYSSLVIGFWKVNFLKIRTFELLFKFK